MPIIEVLGPAATGKTSVVGALKGRLPARCSDLPVRWFDTCRALVEIEAALLPAYVHDYRHSRCVTGCDLKRMVWIRSWHLALRSRLRDRQDLTILDHGPLFMLAWLREFGSEFVKGEGFTRWSRAACAAWGDTLDVVVCLDAPDATLVHRIRSREADHMVKGQRTGDICNFLQRCRRSFDQVLSEASTRGHLKVLRFDTSLMEAEAVADRLLEALVTRPDTRDLDCACARSPAI